MLTDLSFDITGGYWPSTSAFPPPELQNTMKAALNCWLRAGNSIDVAAGVTQTSSTNLGARLFNLNTQRAEIAGALVSSRLPYAAIIRYNGGVLAFLSELTSQQVYLDETAVTGVTTSSTAGRLRVSIPAGGGTYNTYDAGFDPPILSGGSVTSPGGGSKNMSGATGVALCAWRTTTNAVSAPSNTVYDTLTAGDVFNIVLPSMVSGQDGWILAGSGVGDDGGELRVVRYVYTTIRGTFTATNGSANLTAGVGTYFMEDLRVGDVVTIDAASYTINTITSQTTATLTAVFAGSTAAGKTALLTTIAAEWYTDERGEVIDFNTFRPVPAAGVFSFLGRTFLWGTDGGSGAVTGPGIRLMLPNNPEHIGLFNITTTRGDDLLNVLPAGDMRSQALYLMTPNSLELVTFTGETDTPYRIRIIHEPGFKTATTGVVYKNRFYGYAERPLRTAIESDVDVDFGIPVYSDMRGWTAANVVLAIDPKNEAVLYCHYNGSTTTTVIPYMTQLEVWGPPIEVTGQVTDFAVVGGTLYLMVLSGGNYRVQTWEGGTGLSGAYVASQYIHDARRWKTKALVFQGYAVTLRVYLATVDTVTDVSSTAGAVLVITTSSSGSALLPEIFTNLKPARGIAMRCEFPTSATRGAFQKLIARMQPLDARR